jgi:DNA-directed RNA polymerase subunit RPC12/RpoP
MTEYSEVKCRKCGQQLRIPNNIGGMLMACPTCGSKFYSDFKLAVPGQPSLRDGVVTKVQEMLEKFW